MANPGYLLKRHDNEVKTIPSSSSPLDVDILPSKKADRLPMSESLLDQPYISA
jgi:hypothetical protein